MPLEFFSSNPPGPFLARTNPTELNAPGDHAVEGENVNYDAKSFHLSASRTGFSLHRTRMSADRTLMSVIRTSLSLIGFGFTIFQFFRYLRTSAPIGGTLPAAAARNFGTALVLLGNLMLILGIWNHAKFMMELRKERKVLIADGLVTDGSPFPVSTTLIVAVLLFLVGLTAVVDMLFRVGPF